MYVFSNTVTDIQRVKWGIFLMQWQILKTFSKRKGRQCVLRNKHFDVKIELPHPHAISYALQERGVMRNDESPASRSWERSRQVIESAS